PRPGPRAARFPGRLPEPARPGGAGPCAAVVRSQPAPAAGAQAAVRSARRLRLRDAGSGSGRGERRERDSNPRYPFGYAGLATPSASVTQGQEISGIARLVPSLRKLVAGFVFLLIVAGAAGLYIPAAGGVP